MSGTRAMGEQRIVLRLPADLTHKEGLWAAGLAWTFMTEHPFQLDHPERSIGPWVSAPYRWPALAVARQPALTASAHWTATRTIHVTVFRVREEDPWLLRRIRASDDQDWLAGLLIELSERPHVGSIRVAAANRLNILTTPEPVLRPLLLCRSCVHRTDEHGERMHEDGTPDGCNHDAHVDYLIYGGDDGEECEGYDAVNTPESVVRGEQIAAWRDTSVNAGCPGFELREDHDV